MDKLLEEIGYKSPITVIREKLNTDFENGILRSVEKVNVEVDREELIKALQYDRDQYEKGFKNGQRYAAEKFAVSINDLLNTPFEGKTESQRLQRKGMEEGLRMALEICKEITEGRDEGK